MRHDGCPDQHHLCCLNRAERRLTQKMSTVELTHVTIRNRVERLAGKAATFLLLWGSNGTQASL